MHDGKTCNWLGTACNLIAQFEGFRSKAYFCPAGYLTIGYGTLVRDFPEYEFKSMSEEKAYRLLTDRVYSDYLKIENMIPKSLDCNCIAAILSFVYNLGINAFERSTMLKKIKLGDLEGAANEFDRWVKAGGETLEGLVKRRAAEKKLFLAGIDK